MNIDRDMFYSGYGYGAMGPIPMQGVNNQPQNSYMSYWNQDINDRINGLERKINRLEQRITRLETPYQNNNYSNNEPDNNMYMM